MATKQGKKWSVPVKCKNKNCWNLTDIDTVMKGTPVKEVYTPYRAALNALFDKKTTGGSVPMSGNIDITEQDLKKLDSITRVVVTRNALYVYRGENFTKKVLQNVESVEGKYIKKFQTQWGKLIHMLENQGQEVTDFANIYRDMYLKRTKTATNEKKTRVNVLDFAMPNLEEVVFVGYDVQLSLESEMTGFLNKITALEQAFNIPSSIEGVLCPLLKQELDNEQDALIKFIKGISENTLKYPKLKKCGIFADNSNRFAGIVVPNNSFLCDMLIGKGLPVVYFKNIETTATKKQQAEVQEEIKEAEEMKALQEVLVRDLTMLATSFKPILDLTNKGVALLEYANPTEMSRWVSNYTQTSVKNYISSDFDRKSSTHRVDKKCIRDLLELLSVDSDVKKVMLSVLALLPKSVTESKNYGVLSTSIHKKETLVSLTKDFASLKSVVQKLALSLVSMHYYILVEYMLKFGMQGVRFTGPMTAIIRENSEVPFRYIDSVIESVNARFTTDAESGTEFPAICYKFLNENARCKTEDVSLSLLIDNVGVIMQQFYHYLRVEEKKQGKV